MSVLEFIFQDFWHWLGTLILVIAICPWHKAKITTNNGEDHRPK